MHLFITESVYRYNVTPKDNLSSSMLLADVLHRYHIRVRDIDTTPEPQITEGRYEKGDIVWVKTKFGNGRVTEVTSQQSVRVNGTPHHVKDLCPFRRLHSSDDEDDTEDSEQPIYLGLDSASNPSDIGGSPTNPDMSRECSPEEDKIQTIPLWRSTKRKDHTRTVICETRDQGECCRHDGQELESDNVDSNDLLYHHHKRACLCLVCRALKIKQVHTGTAIFMHIDHLWLVCFANYKRRV